MGAKAPTAEKREEKTMWSKGIIEIDGTEVSYEVKHFEEGSEF